MTQESEQDTICDSSSSSMNVEQCDYHEEIIKLRTELIALKSSVVEHLHKNNIKNKYIKTFESGRSGLNDTIINTFSFSVTVW